MKKAVTLHLFSGMRGLQRGLSFLYRYAGNMYSEHFAMPPFITLLST